MLTTLCNAFNDYFKEYFWKNKKYFPVADEKNKLKRDVVILIDTDSVVGSTQIDVNHHEQSISSFYESISDENIIEYNTKGIVKHVKECTTLSMNKVTKCVERKSINYIMKHKVTKQMFRITTPCGRIIECTDDHSIEVMRDGIVIDIKPGDILPTDQFIVKT